MVIGGVSINTGDVVVTDDSGIVVVPYEKLDDVIASLAGIRTLEDALDEKVRQGMRIPDDIAALLRSDKVKRL